MVLNSTKGKKERIGKLFQMHSNKENPVEETHRRSHLRSQSASRTSTTGDTLCDPGTPDRSRVHDLPGPR